MTIPESDTELFFEFLEEKNWKLEKVEGIPTIDMDCYFYEKNGLQIKIDVEHWRDTVIHGDNEILNTLLKRFALFKEFHPGDEKKLFQKIERFQGSALIYLLKNLKEIDLISYGILATLNLLFLIPCFLWFSSKSSYSYFELGLLFFVLLIYLFLSRIYIRSIAGQIQIKKSHLNAIKDYPELSYISRANKFISLELKKQLYSKVYDQTYYGCFHICNESKLIIVGNFNLSITRRVNGKIGPQNLKDRAFIYFEFENGQKDAKFQNSKELINYFKAENQFDLAFLSNYQLNGQVYENSCIIFFNELIEHPHVKLFLINKLQHAATSAS
jgi:hypothetical protein